MKTRSFSRGISFHAALAILAMAFCRAEECIQIQAVITQTNVVRLGAGSDSWSFPVTCSVWSNRWRIDNGFVRGGQESAYYDGTNVVYRRLAMDVGQKTAHGNSGLVTIWIAPSPGGHPLGDLGLNIPWLAFCSGGYLKMPNRTVPLPVVDVPGSAESLSFVDKTTAFDDEGGLPKSLELLTSKEHFLNSLADVRLYRTSRLRAAQASRKFNLADGLLRFIYVVQASTNYNGRIFPTLFTYSDYRALDTNSGFTLVAEGVGKLTQIAPAPVPGNVLSNTAQSIFDLRFRQPDKILDAILYSWPKAEIPSTNEPALQDRLQVMLRDAQPIH